MITETLCKAPGDLAEKKFIEKLGSGITPWLWSMQIDACLHTDALFVFPTLGCAPARDLCPS